MHCFVDSAYPIKGETGGSVFIPNSLSLPPCWLPPPFLPTKNLSPLPFLYVSPSTVLDRKPNIGQKASFFACAAHLQFNNHDKKFIGIKSFNIKQCPAGLSLRIKPSCILPLKKNAPSFNPPLLPPSSMSFAARRSQMRKRTIMRKIEKY